MTDERQSQYSAYRIWYRTEAKRLGLLPPPKPTQSVDIPKHS